MIVNSRCRGKWPGAGPCNTLCHRARRPLRSRPRRCAISSSTDISVVTRPLRRFSRIASGRLPHAIGSPGRSLAILDSVDPALVRRNDVDGYRLGWQMVVDGLKLTPANPSFLQARDAILLALDHMLDQRRISRTTHQAVRQAAQAAFGRFGMGPNATTPDAGVDGIVEDVVTGAVA